MTRFAASPPQTLGGWVRSWNLLAKSSKPYKCHRETINLWCTSILAKFQFLPFSMSSSPFRFHGIVKTWGTWGSIDRDPNILSRLRIIYISSDFFFTFTQENLFNFRYRFFFHFLNFVIIIFIYIYFFSSYFCTRSMNKFRRIYIKTKNMKINYFVE